MYRKFDKNLGKEVVTIYPGEYYVTKEDLFIYTVLGSCISVCLYDPKKGVGGMNHFMLAGIDTITEMSEDNFLNQNTRYGMAAMENLINAIMKIGGDRNRFRAKVFGGAKMIKSSIMDNSVPENNIAFVNWFLKSENIFIEAMDVGLDKARKVFFNPFTGKAFLKHIIPTEQDLKEEIQYEKEILKNRKTEKTKKENDIELF